jgi:hypothetical protein
MKKTILKSAITIGILTLIFSFENPAGWFKAGSQPNKYDMGIDVGSGRDGKNAATIKSKSKTIKGFGTLLQSCSAEKFLGQRVRMSAYMKSENVTNWAGLWLRVDQLEPRKELAFDNMQDRPVKGKTDWTKYEIVLDVPKNASNLVYGALIDGTGQIWFDDVNFEMVDSTVAVTGIHKKSEPINTDFEH